MERSAANCRLSAPVCGGSCGDRPRMNPVDSGVGGLGTLGSQDAEQAAAEVVDVERAEHAAIAVEGGGAPGFAGATGAVAQGEVAGEDLFEGVGRCAGARVVVAQGAEVIEVAATEAGDAKELVAVALF